MPQVERKARNQALFREVNERIAELSTRLGVDASTQTFICECSRTGCTDMITVPLATYARVRRDSTLFVVVAGHQDPSHETVIEDLGACLVTKTQPEAKAPSKSNSGVPRRVAEQGSTPNTGPN